MKRPRIRLVALFLAGGLITLPTPASGDEAAAVEPEIINRQEAIAQRLCRVFDTKPAPSPGDTLASCLPPEAQALSVRNPGFGFTYANGLRPHGVWIVDTFREGQPASMRGKTKGLTDPILGWTGEGCPGMESLDAGGFHNPPDGSNAFLLAHGRPNVLSQVIKDALQPNRRYVLLAEVYQRKRFLPPTPDEMIFDLLDGNGNPLPIVGLHRIVPAPDPATGFAVATISLVTGPTQPPGDLTIRLGLNSDRKRVRGYYDNVRLWSQPLRLPAP